ncbi:F0F1 ATP synthase subunit delta [Candidatus Roizmanbacteria bacterium]|nr:F0F1 ATP synthase subunit delta [Candidatus Roizmanbacteria bacterium]
MVKINSKLKKDLKNYLLNKMRSERQRVIVYSSFKLSDNEKKLLKQKLPSIPFQKAEYKLDDSLLAGVLVSVGSKIIDLSVKGTLSNLKNIVYESS